MDLGPETPGWSLLAEELAKLVADTHAHNAYVVDAWGGSWCAAHDFSDVLPEPAAALLESALSRLDKPLTKGGTLDAVISNTEAEPTGHAYLCSFAAVRILFLRFSGPFEPARARDAVRTALPRIETLTLSLPSPDGPASGEAVRPRRA